MAVTRIDRVMVRLQEIARESVRVEVIHGPAINEVPRDVLAFGTGGEVSYSSDLEAMDGHGAPRYRELWSIPATVAVWSGDDDVDAALSAAVAEVNLLEAGLASHHRDEGVWESVEIGGPLRFTIGHSPQGLMLFADFIVEGESIL